MYIKKASITKAPHKQILVEVAPLIDRFSSQRFIEAPNWLGLSLIEGQRITAAGRHCKIFLKWLHTNVDWLPEHVFVHTLLAKSTIPWHKDTDNPRAFSNGLMLPIFIPKKSYVEFEDGIRDTYEMGYCYKTRFGIKHRVINGSKYKRVMIMITPPPFITFYDNYNRKTELITVWG